MELNNGRQKKLPSLPLKSMSKIRDIERLEYNCIRYWIHYIQFGQGIRGSGIERDNI